MDNLTAVESVFLAALEKAVPEERTAYLDEACRNDPELRARVERLLKAQPKVGSFLQPPATDPAATVDAPGEAVGTTIGPYKLLQQIGEGGMGTVYMAEQTEPVKRLVALKIIKPGMDSAQIIARFEAERQALAMMDHPNIARVFDTGATDAGRPYFVMELVKGVPITKFCDDRALSPRERLELFVPVCQAVQHAHQKGIIHRDLKPSNVLVALYDDKPVPKVIDFGVAKATSQKLTERTLFTAFGSFVGTLEYMSPEQATFNALDIDTRSDVYALGVMLYELMTGSTPVGGDRLKRAALDELLRIIREEEPPRPSTRLSQSGEALASISARRKTEPAKLGKVLRNELDWVVMKALEKDRTRRYESATALARDIQHYLSDEAVEACPPTAGYRLRKFAGKNRKALVTAGAFVLLLLVGVVASSWLAVRAIQAEGVAREQRNAALFNEEAAKEHARTAQREAENHRLAREQLRRTLYASEMSMLLSAWEKDDLDQFDQLLERQRSEEGLDDVRGPEWYCWDHLRHADQRTVALAGGFHALQQPALSPDGTHFAALTLRKEGGEFRLWDTATGVVRHTLLKGIDASQPLEIIPPRLVFSPDSKRVALSLRTLEKPKDPRQANLPLLFMLDIPEGVKREVKVWNAGDGREVLTIPVQGRVGRFDCLAFTPNGKLLALGVASPVGPKSSDIQVWNLDEGKVAITFTVTGQVRALAFNSDNDHLAAALSPVGPADHYPDNENRVQIWNLAGGKETRRIANDGAIPESVAFSPTAAELAVAWEGPKEQALTLHNARTGSLNRTIQGITGKRVVYSANGASLTVPPKGSRVRVWDAKSGAVRFTVRGHAQTSAVAFNATGDRLVTVGQDGLVKEWSEAPARPPLEGVEKASKASQLAYAFAANGDRLVARAFSGGEGDKSALEIRLWKNDESKGRSVVKTQLDLAGHRALVLSTQGTCVAVEYALPGASPANPLVGLKVWDTETGKELFSSEGRSLLPALALSPDGSRIAWARDHRVTVWEIATGRELLDVPESWDLLFQLVFSPDSKRLAWVGEKRIRLWDVAARKETTITDLGGYAGMLAFSPDGTRLAAAVGSFPLAFAEAKVWDATTGRELLSLKGHTNLEHLAFSPNGNRLACVNRPKRAEFDGYRVLLYDLASGLPLLRLDSPFASGNLVEVAFHPASADLYLFRRNTSHFKAGGYHEWWAAAPREEANTGKRDGD